MAGSSLLTFRTETMNVVAWQAWHVLGGENAVDVFTQKVIQRAVFSEPVVRTQTSKFVEKQKTDVMPRLLVGESIVQLLIRATTIRAPKRLFASRSFCQFGTVPVEGYTVRAEGSWSEVPTWSLLFQYYRFAARRATGLEAKMCQSLCQNLE